MCGAKHLQSTLLRGQQLLQQLHTPVVTVVSATATTASTASASGSLRLLPSRLIIGPSLDSGARSIHTQSHLQPLQLHQQQQQQQQQKQQQQHYHHRSCQRHNSRVRQQQDHPCSNAACLLHTSALNRSLPSPSPSETAKAATETAAAASSLDGTDNISRNNTDSGHPSSVPISSTGDVHAAAANAHVFTEQTALRWTSELPWIDPLTQSSYEPGQNPIKPSNGGGTLGGTGRTQGSTITTTKTSSFFDQPFQNTRHNYVFAHGASGFAKNPGKAPTLTPEEDRAYFSVQVGEDSYFRRHDALGVADGANPALYSRKLMHYAFLELEKYDNIEEEAFYDYFNVNPVQILEKSYEQSARDAKKEGLIGSSTACLAILRDDELRIANLGDCGVSVIRHNEFIFRTEEQQHSFNYPYQLGTGSTDSPTDAQVFTVKVESGDIVVMGTDGIFDNLFDEDILEEVVRCVSGVDPNQNQSPYGTGKPPAILSGKGVGGLWSGLTSGAAKLASTSTSTIAAITGKTTAAAGTADTAATSTATSAGEAEPIAALLSREDRESSSELSPIAAAAIAAAHSTALPPSAALYTIPTASQRQYERKIPEPSVISDALAKRAKSVSEDTRHHGSPFQSRAMQEGLYYQGGKQDDMSVLVAIIKVAEDSPDRR
ncbi:hypothetical protein BGZ54_006929 [Gamsiella multidivaricata]|nr:hypothetical protein BGZ54_006929 [Gamsiella multidivaricata]